MMDYCESAVSLALKIIGDDGEERWQIRMSWGPLGRGEDCCERGHYTPEAAAAHGTEKAASWLCQEVRRLPADSYGGSLLARSA